MSITPSSRPAPRRTAVLLALVAALATVLLYALLVAVTGADATPRRAAHALPSAARAKLMKGRAGRCARGSLRFHASYSQYALCLHDGRVRIGVKPKATTTTTTTTTTTPGTTVTVTTPTPAPVPPVPPAPQTKLTAAIYGDAPYGTTPTDTSETQATPAFIDKVNADPAVSLVVHVGDIHSGKEYCTAAYDQQIADLWKAFEDPLVYTPGDNEWTDCHKSAEGGGSYTAGPPAKITYVTDPDGNPVDYAGGDPVANLDLVRRKFFPVAGQTLGRHPLAVTSQAQAFDPAHPEDREYIENVRWEQAGVLFVTVDLPGGSNNDTDPWYGAPAMSATQSGEVAARTAADLRWLKAAFAQAKGDDVKGVVVNWQADVWDVDGKSASHLSQYDQFVDALADGTTAFGKPVLLLNGDSHVYKSDNPLAASDPLNSLHPGHDVANFHRVVVHGSTVPLEYLRLTIDTTTTNPTTDTSFGPFSWERVIG